MVDPEPIEIEIRAGVVVLLIALVDVELSELTEAVVEDAETEVEEERE